MKPIFYRMKVYYRIIIPFMMVIILGVVTTLPYGLRLVNQLNTEKVDKEIFAISGVVSNYLQYRMDELLAYLQTAIQNESVKVAISSGDRNTLVKYFLPLKSRLRIGIMAAYAPSGRVILNLGEPKVLREIDNLDTVAKALLGINIKSLEVTSNQMMLLAAIPNEIAGKGMDGALIAGFVIDKAFMEDLARLVGHPVALISLDGRLVMSKDPAITEHLKSRAAMPLPDRPFFMDLGNSLGIHRVAVNDLRIYNQAKVRFLVGTSMREIFALRNRISAYIFFMCGLGTLAVIIIGMLVARSINNPVRRLVALAENVGRGNLDASIQEVTGDELGDLALSFNRMVVALRENINEIQSSRAKIATYAHDLEVHSLQLQRDKKEIEALLKNMRDGLIMIDRQGTIMAINPEALRIVETTEETCLGQDIRKALTHFLDLLVDSWAFLKLFGFGDTEEGSEISSEITLQEPHKTVYRVKINPVFHESGSLIGRIVIFTNITREKEIEEMKNNFLATISHELRTPLTSIKGSLNLLLDGNLGILTQDQREFLKIASHNSDRLTSLVSNLLDLARMEAGEFQTRKTDCDLVYLLKKSLSDIKVQALNRGVKIDFDSAVKAGPITADPERIIQLLSNLLDNAIKFSAEGGRVTVNISEITLRREDDIPPPLSILPPGVYFQVHVIDLGQGIPSDQIEKIFDKFHQVDMSSTRQAGGTGLGLAIARTIVKEHGGLIWAENRPEGGSRFSFLLPRAFVKQRITLPRI